MDEKLALIRRLTEGLLAAYESVIEEFEKSSKCDLPGYAQIVRNAALCMNAVDSCAIMAVEWMEMYQLLMTAKNLLKEAKIGGFSKAPSDGPVIN